MVDLNLEPKIECLRNQKMSSSVKKCRHAHEKRLFKTICQERSKCANEGGVCKCNGKVRFGARSGYGGD